MTSPALEAACDYYEAVIRDSFWDRLLNNCLGKALADRLHISRLEKALEKSMKATCCGGNDVVTPAYNLDGNGSLSGKGQKALNYASSESTSVEDSENLSESPHENESGAAAMRHQVHMKEVSRNPMARNAGEQKEAFIPGSSKASGGRELPLDVKIEKGCDLGDFENLELQQWEVALKEFRRDLQTSKAQAIRQTPHTAQPNSELSKTEQDRWDRRRAHSLVIQCYKEAIRRHKRLRFLNAVDYASRSRLKSDRVGSPRSGAGILSHSLSAVHRTTSKETCFKPLGQPCRCECWHCQPIVFPPLDKPPGLRIQAGRDAWGVCGLTAQDLESPLAISNGMANDSTYCSTTRKLTSSEDFSRPFFTRCDASFTIGPWKKYYIKRAWEDNIRAVGIDPTAVGQRKIKKPLFSNEMTKKFDNLDEFRRPTGTVVHIDPLVPPEPLDTDGSRDSKASVDRDSTQLSGNHPCVPSSRFPRHWIA